MKIVYTEAPHRSHFERRALVYTKKGKLLGEIQSLHIDAQASLGGEPTVHVAIQRGRNYGVKATYTFDDALHFLGISTKEINDYYDLPW